MRGFAYKTINGSQAAMLNLEYRRDLIDNLDIRFLDNLISLDKIQGVGFLISERAGLAVSAIAVLKRYRPGLALAF